MELRILLGAGSVIIVLLLGCANHSNVDGQKDSGIRGNVLSESDVMTQPHRPLSALVLAVPSTRIKELLTDAGGDPERTPVRTKFELSEALFEKYVAGHGHSGQDGHYEIPLSPGDYYLCLANFDRSDDEPVVPAHVSGCVEISVPSGAWLDQDIFWGLGGAKLP